MRARVWGSRGSLAAPGPETVRYGGNTSCVEVRLDDGTLIVLDAGTGIRPLGLTLGDELPRTIHVLLTHLHIDHIEGLAFFGPLWRPDVDLHVWGPPSPLRSLERRIARYLSPPLFPIHLQDIPSHPKFHDVPDEDWKLGAGLVRARPVSHRGPTVGYRISENGQSIAYIPDHEPALGVDLRVVEPEWISGHAVAHDADVMFHDSQYTEEEYAQRIGWGHSSVAHVVTFAEVCAVRQLVMFHHDPLHTDDELEAHLRRATEIFSGDGSPPVLAYEGMDLNLS
ncbi:MAG: MBL fold metallo-hydrolase [Actinomycetota bacterium]|nr:MBL fold metallo-hydrolase [Actinomycetota bacterium]